MFSYKKILVIGCSGSGKTTFSIKLSEIIHCPLYHLDAVYWNVDGTHISRNDLISKEKEILTNDRWIIDGNFRNTLELRIRECDLIFFFDIPTQQCIDGVFDRVGKERPDLPCELPVNDELITLIRNFNSEVRPMIYDLFERYPDNKVITFNSRESADEYLNYLKNSLEYWNLYDINRHLLRDKTFIRDIDNFNLNEYHLVVYAAIFDSKGELLIQQRQPFKSGWSNKWDITCGGSALVGETSQQAMQRELYEELGLSIDLTNTRPCMTLNSNVCFDDFYIINEDINIFECTLQPDEVRSMKWASYNDILDMIDAGEFVPYLESFIKFLFDMRKQKNGYSINESNQTYINEFNLKHFNINNPDDYSNVRVGCRAIILKNNKILLSYEQKENFYVLPGGGMEEDESFEQCCIREVEEESGYIVETVKPYAVTYEYHNDAKFINHYFICEIIGSCEQRLTNVESEKQLIPRWIDVDEAFDIFSKYNSYRNIAYKKYSMTLREYTVLNALMEDRNYGFNIQN